MSDSPRVSLLPLLGLLIAFLIAPRFACAQALSGESVWSMMDVTNAINRAIEESKGGEPLREKVVRRFAECSLTYGGLIRKASSPEAKKSYLQAQLATMEIESAIARPLEPKKKLELEILAQRSAAMTLDLARTQGDKELVPFLKICRSFNEAKEIDNAVRQLARE